VTVVVLPVGLAVATVLTTRAVRVELSRETHSTPRIVYLASTAVLLGVLAIAPVTGFVAYVGGHAGEYLLMVRWRIGRTVTRERAGDHVGALARRIGRDGTLAVYAVVVIALMVGIRVTNGSPAVAVGALTLGALHLLYDGVIWRSRPPRHGERTGKCPAGNPPL
jgi:hypothetical protein